MSIFVSWRGTDRDVKNELVAALRNLLPDEEVWESDEGCKTRPVEEFIDQIRRSEIFVVIVSDETMKPSFVINEITEAHICEMNGTLNMLVYKITDTPYNAALAGHLNHLTDSNHVARLKGTGDGYQTLASRIKDLLEKRRNGMPENPYDTFAPQIKGTAVSAGYYVPNSRDPVFEAFDQAFEQSNVIFAAQLNGYGRKCAAREYALERGEMFKTVVFLHAFCGSIREFFLQGIEITNINTSVFENMTENEIILNKAKLLQRLGKDTLIIVPELLSDPGDDRFVYDALAMLGCRVIFVTQTASPQLRQAFPVIPVDRLTDEHLRTLFFNFYEASDEEQADLSDPLTAFFDSIDGHTKSVELTANFLAEEFGIYPDEIPEILENIRPDSENELSGRIFSLISEIFDMKKFGETERKILLAATWFARVPMDEKQFVAVLQAGDCYDAKIMRALIARGWLENDRASRTISIDGFFADVCTAKIPMDEELLGKFFHVVQEKAGMEFIDMSLGCIHTSVRRLKSFFVTIGLPLFCEFCDPILLMLKNAAPQTGTPAEVAERKNQLYSDIDRLFSDELLVADLKSFAGMLFGLAGLASALADATPQAGGNTLSTRFLSQVIDSEMLDSFSQLAQECEDSRVGALFGALIKALLSNNVSEIVSFYQLAANEFSNNFIEDSEDWGIIHFYLLFLGELLAPFFAGMPYLQLCIFRAWSSLVMDNGTISQSRAFTMFKQYFGLLFDMDDYGEDFDWVYGLLMATMDGAKKEGFFSGGDLSASYMTTNLSCAYAYGLAARGDPPEAMEIFFQLLQTPESDVEAAQELLLTGRNLMNLMVRQGDTDWAEGIAAATLQFADDLSGRCRHGLDQDAQDAIEDLSFFQEAMAQSGAEDSFTDNAEEYLDYYRKFATEAGDKRLFRRYEAIAQRAKTMDLSGLTQFQLQAMVQTLQQRAAGGEHWEKLAPEVFALVSEAGFRTLGYRHHLVQYIGGAAIADGKIAEIQNGEGKTYTIILAAFLHQLYGRQVHIIDLSEYLTQRNFHWMKGVFEYLGQPVYLLDEHDDRCDRLCQENAVIYETTRAALFNHMRAEINGGTGILRPDVAIIDEAEELLVSHSGKPYTLSSGKNSQNLAPILQAIYDTVCSLDPDDDAFFVRCASGSISSKPPLLDALYTLCHSRQLDILSMHEKMSLYLDWCIQALFFDERGKDYFVVGNHVYQENHTTGKFDGIAPEYAFFLQRREGLLAEDATLFLQKNINAIIFREFADRFRILTGTTATASSMKAVLQQAYGLDVVSIPPNTPTKRIDHSPVVFVEKEPKLAAIVELIQEKNEIGQPVLVVTGSVPASVDLSHRLHRVGISHTLLNAENADSEAGALEYAGCYGAVTVTTAIANRGVDIRLGGNPRTMARAHLQEAGYPFEDINAALSSNREEDNPLRKKLDDLTAYYRQKTDADRAVINQLGGLCVIGTTCFDDLRIEQQMRGRCGRQGDNGESYVFFSFADNALRRLLYNNYDSLMLMFQRMGVADQPLDAMGFLVRAIEKARTRVLNNTCSNVLNNSAMLYRPAARQAILGLAQQIFQEKGLPQKAVEQYYAKSTANIQALQQLLQTGSCGDSVISMLKPVLPAVSKKLSDKQASALLLELLPDYYQYRSRRLPPQAKERFLSAQQKLQAPHPFVEVIHVLAQRDLENGWADYLAQMEREVAQAWRIFQNTKRYQQHIQQHSETLCRHILETAVTNALLLLNVPQIND